MATTLWKSDSVADWEAAIEEYEARLQRLTSPTLVELDTWMLADLPKAVSARDGATRLTKAELSKLMQWKLTKGKWRPLLQKYIDGLPEANIIEATTEAFKLSSAGDVAGAMKALTVLRGVGPATASAVLAAIDFHVPFMCDEAMMAAMNGQRKYTASFFDEFIEVVAAKAESLNSSSSSSTDGTGAGGGAGASDSPSASPGPGSNGSDFITASPVLSGPWSAQKVQLALWSAASTSMKPRKPKKTKAKAKAKVTKKKPTKAGRRPSTTTTAAAATSSPRKRQRSKK